MSFLLFHITIKTTAFKIKNVQKRQTINEDQKHVLVKSKRNLTASAQERRKITTDKTRNRLKTIS